MSYRRNAKRRPQAGARRRRLALKGTDARPSPIPTKARWTQSRCRAQAKELTRVRRAMEERTHRGGKRTFYGPPPTSEQFKALKRKLGL